MDEVLKLKIFIENDNSLSDSEIASFLSNSKIVAKLTTDFEENRLFNIIRLICLAEIPFADTLPYTQKIIEYVNENIATPQGFSYIGDIDNIVPCYNAMLLETYTKLGNAFSNEAQNALNWIKKYQVFERNQVSGWQYNGINKHGGCMNAVPCYIGIGKTIRALLTYMQATNYADKEVELLIKKGVQYMLDHHMYQRLSSGKPISAHITDIMFPQSYMLSLLDLVYIVGMTNNWHDKRTEKLKDLLSSKKIEGKGWKIDYIYSHKGYKPFDAKIKCSDWVNDFINKYGPKTI